MLGVASIRICAQSISLVAVGRALPAGLASCETGPAIMEAARHIWARSRCWWWVIYWLLALNAHCRRASREDGESQVVLAGNRKAAPLGQHKWSNAALASVGMSNLSSLGAICDRSHGLAESIDAGANRW